MSAAELFDLEPLPGANFGLSARLKPGMDFSQLLKALAVDAAPLIDPFYDAGGILVIKDAQAINEDPTLLVDLSRFFGPEVENYHETLTPKQLIHEGVPEIAVISNLPPASFEVPQPPDPPLTEDGKLPVQFPHRKGWHTDQSFRRPPPDVSLFYAMQPCPQGQGQTLYADGTSAYEALPDALKKRVEGLDAIHTIPFTGRGEEAVRAGETPTPLLPHQASQRQPIVRMHPVTRKKGLYLCEDGQLDWILGPIADMPPGPDGEGAKILYEVMTHFTQPRFTYIHEWDAGDIVIHDNRNTVHSATWFDAKKHGRVMWRTTVMGNPGEYYAGEARSWLPESGDNPIGDLKYRMNQPD